MKKKLVTLMLLIFSVAALSIIFIYSMNANESRQYFSPPLFKFIIYEKRDVKLGEYKGAVDIRIIIDASKSRDVISWINKYAWPEPAVNETPSAVIYFMKNYFTEAGRVCVYSSPSSNKETPKHVTHQELEELNRIADDNNSRLK